MQQDDRKSDRNFGFSGSIVEEFRTADFSSSLRRDMQETYDFYLADEERSALEAKGPIGRAVYSAFYLVRGLFMKLTPIRRGIVLVGLVLAITGVPDSITYLMGGFLALLFVLGLELKDKLQARGELAAGRAVQLALQPSTTPIVDGWEIWFHTMPANDVGGDLVDYMPLPEGRLALTLGDVAGKGLPAALLASKLQSTIRALAPDAASLESLAVHLNTIFCRDGLPSRFASLIQMVIAPDQPHVRLLNAGHMPPIVVRDGHIESLSRGAPAIGLTREARFSAESVRLEPGDLLVVYSDGVTEARNEVGRFYEDDRFEDLIRHAHGMDAPSLGNRILDSVTEFVQGARQSDDLSLIVLRWKGSGDSPEQIE